MTASLLEGELWHNVVAIFLCGSKHFFYEGCLHRRTGNAKIISCTRTSKIFFVSIPNLPGNRPCMVGLLMWLSYGLPLPLLLGSYSARLLTRTISLQRGPLEAPIALIASRSYDRGRYG